MESSQKGRDQHNRDAVKRRSYAKPQIQIYGDLLELTNAVGKNGSLDGGATMGPSTTRA